MTQEEFYREACLRAMEGLLAASGHYRDELIKNPCEYVATAARQYATELTEQVFQPGYGWDPIDEPPYDGGPDVSPQNYFANPDNWNLDD